MAVRAVPQGTRGFDCNFVLSPAQAQAMVRHGYRFVARYVPRVNQAAHDLTSHETHDLLSAGLAIMPVQHVEQENWDPNAAKGKAYGLQAARSAVACAIEKGTTVWLDLEGVRLKTDAEAVIQYCNAWYDEVSSAGFLPGIYIGWQAILTPDQQYRRLKFTRYWSAYNLNDDLFPATVGACMWQGEARKTDYPKGWKPKSFEIDTNIVIGDTLGRFPMVTAPALWNVWD